MFSIVLAFLQIALSSVHLQSTKGWSCHIKHICIVPVVSFEETAAVKAGMDCYMQKENI